MLYELGAHGVTASRRRSRRELAIDAGQLSRVLKRLEADGSIDRLPSPPTAAGSGSS